MEDKNGFNFENLVNNLKDKRVDCNFKKNLEHTINNNSYCSLLKSFYAEHKNLMIELAEENINTIVDLNNYVNWIKYGK